MGKGYVSGGSALASNLPRAATTGICIGIASTAAREVVMLPCSRAEPPNSLAIHLFKVPEKHRAEIRHRLCHLFGRYLYGFVPTVVVLIHELDSKFVIIIVVIGEPCAHVIEDVVAQDSELILIVIAQVLRIIILVQYGHEKVLGIFAPYCIGIDLSYFVAIEYKRFRGLIRNGILDAGHAFDRVMAFRVRALPKRLVQLVVHLVVRAVR